MTTPLKVDLCLELQRAGFPQTTQFAFVTDGDGTNADWFYVCASGDEWLDRPGYRKSRRVVYCPNCDELLEQMGTSFFNLGTGQKGYYADGYDPEKDTGFGMLNETGETPVEALAALWLAGCRKT